MQTSWRQWWRHHVICPVLPFISGTRKATNFKFGRCIHSVHANKSPLKILEKRERGRIQGLPKFIQYPLLSQERVKLRTSNFVRTFLVSIETKAHYKFRESSGFLVRTLEIFQGTHILGASRGRLYDSSAFLFCNSFCCRWVSYEVSMTTLWCVEWCTEKLWAALSWRRDRISAWEMRM